jgi:hypothetical protein
MILSPYSTFVKGMGLRDVDDRPSVADPERFSTTVSKMSRDFGPVNEIQRTMNN